MELSAQHDDCAAVFQIFMFDQVSDILVSKTKTKMFNF